MTAVNKRGLLARDGLENRRDLFSNDGPESLRSVEKSWFHRLCDVDSEGALCVDKQAKTAIYS